MIIQTRRWLTDRHIVIVTDMGYVALELLHSCQSLSRSIIFISRLRLDAAFFESVPPRMPDQAAAPEGPATAVSGRAIASKCRCISI